MERRRGDVNWVERERERERAGERECVESALRQRHVGDVVWLPQAEERGGVGERWKSAESVRVRERNKAGGEEARSKTRKAWIERRGRRKKKEQQQRRAAEEREKRRNETRQARTTRDFSTFSLGVSPFLRRGKLTGRWNEERTVRKKRHRCKTKGIEKLKRSC